MVTCAIIFLSLFAVFVIWVAAKVILHYRRFSRSPEVRWKNAVAKRGLAMTAAFDALAREFQDDDDEYREAREEELEPFLKRQLASTPVSELLVYPGIGPATVDKLRQAGFSNLEPLRNSRLAALDLGEKREADLIVAIGQAVAAAQARLEAPSNLEVQMALEQLNRRESARLERMKSHQQKMLELSDSLDALIPYAEIADEITVDAYFSRQPILGLTKELLETPIDELIARNRQFGKLPANAPTPQAPRVLPSKGKASKRAKSRKAAQTPSSPPPSSDLFRAHLDAPAAKAAPAKKEHPRVPHLRVTAEFGIAVARADGKVAQAERETIRRYLKQIFGHEVELLPWVDPLMEAAEKKPRSLDECLTLLFGLFDDKERQALYRFACDIADATGKRNAKEKQYLDKIASAWGIEADSAPPTATPQAVIAVATPPAALQRSECFTALEIAIGSPLSGDLIRRQYRLFYERFDPAKFESHGADFVKVAKEKREKVEQAARRLIEELGEKLEEDKKPEPSQDMRHNPDLDAAFGM